MFIKKVNSRLEKQQKIWYTSRMTESNEVIPSRAAVGAWSVDRYVRLLRPWLWPTALGSILLVNFGYHQLIVTSLQVLTCAWVGRLVSRRGGRRVEALTAGAMSGLTLGLASGISRFIVTPSGYWLVNILFETLLFGILGAMISVAVHSLLNRKKLST